jgi:hypothetical protein
MRTALCFDPLRAFDTKPGMPAWVGSFSGPYRRRRAESSHVNGILISSALKFQSGMVAASTVPPMKNAERTALRMIRRYGTSEPAIQQAHAYDIGAITDEERAFWRAVLAELRLYGVPHAA